MLTIASLNLVCHRLLLSRVWPNGPRCRGEGARNRRSKGVSSPEATAFTPLKSWVESRSAHARNTWSGISSASVGSRRRSRGTDFGPVQLGSTMRIRGFTSPKTTSVRWLLQAV
jgi:hypothetical protein